MSSAVARHSFVQRVVGIVLLRRATIEEVKEDPAALKQAAFVVIAVPLIYRLNPFSSFDERSIAFSERTYHYGGTLAWTLGIALGSLAFALVVWVLSALVFRFVVVRLLGGASVETTWIELARPLGFTNAVYLFGLVAGIPVVESLISIALPIWTMAIAVVILSQSFQISKWRAFATVIITWLAATIALLLLLCVLLSQTGRPVERWVPITPPGV